MIQRLAPWLVAAALVGACGDDNTSSSNNNTNNSTNNSTNNTTNNSTNNTTNNSTNNTNNSTNNTTNNTVEQLEIPGLTGPVAISTDSNGMTHISCAVDADCIAAQGYAHARDRFSQMDVRRRLGRGRISSLAGSLALSTDRAFRTKFMAPDGQYLEDKFYNGLSPSAKSYLDSYTVGVNAWLNDLRNDRNGATLSDEYSFPLFSTSNIPDWEPQDSAACALVLMDDLSNSSDVELSQAALAETVSGTNLFALLGQISATGSSTMIAAGSQYPPQLNRLPDRSKLDDAVNRIRHDQSLFTKARENQAPAELWRTESGFGSNNWVVGPTRSTTNKAFLANDPHLGLSNPALWYLVSLDSKTDGTGDLHAAGVSFAGLPSILLGRNEHIAWGATVVFYDLADVYVEELDPTGKKVNFNGNMVDIIEVPHTYQVASGNPVTDTIRIVPHHGPIIEWDPANNRAVSMKWTGHQVDTDFDAFFGLARAGSVAEAKTALENATTVNQNFVVMDDQDNIGWFPYSRVPIRSWASLETPPWMPLPGTGEYEWEGFMDYADLPQLINPPNGFIATANQDMSGALVDGDPTNDGYNMLQSFPAKGYRHQRILDLISDTPVSPQQLVDMQGDTYVLAAAGIVPGVLEQVSLIDGMLTADQQIVVDALQAWNYTCPTGLSTSDPTSPASTDAAEVSEALGCTVFHALLDELTAKTFADDVMGSGASTRSMYTATYLAFTQPQLLSLQGSYWDNLATTDISEDETTIVMDAIGATALKLKAEYTTDTDAWLWGRLHTLTLEADLINAVTPTYNNGPYAAPGGQWTVNVANPRNAGDSNFTFGAGPSMRLVVENTANGLVSKISFPGGNKHFRDSDYYDNLLQGWLKNEPVALLFTQAEIAAAAVESEEILPAP